MDAEQAYADSVTAEVSANEVIKLLELSGEFFIEFFLGEELTMAVPQLHKDIWERLISEEFVRNLLAIPRDHAKTTLAKLAVVYHFLFRKYRFCAYASSTNGIAKNACRDIMQFFKSDNFRTVFGDVKIIKESETESIWIFDLPIGNGRVKRCILRAVGANQQMRGINIDNQRPDFAVLDDIEDNDIVESPSQQKKLDLWLFGPFLKALARKSKVILLGNMLSKTSLLARLSQQPVWNPVVFGALVIDNVTGTLSSLWPDRWSLAQLIADFKEYRTLGLVETWMCEMMNMPGHGKNGFTADSVYYQPAPVPDGIKAAWITLDPAFGATADTDESAIALHCLPEDGVPMVVEVIHGHFTELQIFNIMLDMARRWNAWVWGIESVAAQKVLITLFEVWLAQRQMLYRTQLLPLTAGSGNPKIARIRAWVNEMKERNYALNEDTSLDILTQLLSFDVTKTNNKDDIIDACAYGPQMLSLYRGLLLAHYQGQSGQVTAQDQIGMEVENV